MSHLVRFALLIGVASATHVSAQKQGGGNPPPPPPPPPPVTSGIVVEPTGNVELGYATDPTLGLRLTHAGDALESQAHIFQATDLWAVEMWDVAGGQNVTRIVPSDCSFDFSYTGTATSLWARWKDCTVKTLPAGSPPLPSFDVIVTAVAPANDTAIELKIDVDFTSSDVSLYSVVFPRLAIEERLPGTPAKQVLTWPKQGGLLYPDPLHSGVLPSPGTLPKVGPPQNGAFVHPGQLSMQFFAYYNWEESEPACLMLGTRDIDGHRKEVSPPTVTSGTPAVMNFQVRNVPGDHLSVTSFDSPYPAVIGVIRGDWYDACREYRKWATGPSIPWSAATPMHASQSSLPLERKFSQILADTELFGLSPVGSCVFQDTCDLGGDPDFQQNYDYSGLLDLTEDIQDQKTFFGVDYLTTVLYKWDAHTLSFPGIYEPVQPGFFTEGEEMFTAGFDYAVYFNPNRATLSIPTMAGQSRLPGDFFPEVRVLDQPTPLVSDVTPLLAKGRDQQDLCVLSCAVRTIHTRDQACSLDSTTTNTLNCLDRISYALDHRSEFVREYVVQWIEALKRFGPTADQGPKGVYMDFYSHQNPQLSYNPLAPHEGFSALSNETGGGKGWTASKLQNLTDIRALQRATEQDFFVYSEGHQEMYNNLVELVFADHLFENLPRFDCNTGTVLREIAPLFLTVYHDYQLTLGAAPINGPDSLATSGSETFMREQRQRAAAQLYFGHVPGAGSFLSDKRLSRGLSDPTGPFGKFALMLQDVYAVVTDPTVRDYQMFGERWRDPEVLNAAEVDDCRPDAYLPFAQEQPFVYVSAFGRQTPQGPAVGVLLVNWSEIGDPAAIGGGAAGDQVITFEIDPLEYGLAGEYLVRDLGATSAQQVNFGSGPRTFQWTVPATDAVFVLFEPN